jgi:hypothetical protein
LSVQWSGKLSLTGSCRSSCHIFVRIVGMKSIPCESLPSLARASGVPAHSRAVVGNACGRKLARWSPSLVDHSAVRRHNPIAARLWGAKVTLPAFAELRGRHHRRHRSPRRANVRRLGRLCRARNSEQRMMRWLRGEVFPAGQAHRGQVTPIRHTRYGGDLRKVVGRLARLGDWYPVPVWQPSVRFQICGAIWKE